MQIKSIEILPTAQSAEGYDFSRSVAVVIDVLRATSVITMAIANGAKAVAPVLSPDEGFALAETLGRESVILGGERNADRIPGFDLGNSPQDYKADVVGGKTVILTTTNGTVALKNSQCAQAVIAASMLNYDAAVRQALALADERGAESLVFVCSGNYGVLTLEDCYCAAVMADVAVAACPAAEFASDQAIALHALSYGREVGDTRLVAMSRHYKKLISKGYGADIDVCLCHPGTVAAVPLMKADGMLCSLEKI